MVRGQRVPRRPGLTHDRVIEVAVDLINKEGLESLSFAKLAKHFGVKAPSLYNHVEGMEGLRRALRLRGLAHLLSVLQRAAVGRSGKEALTAIARAYRDYARIHPGLYMLTLQASEGDDTEVYKAGRAVLEVVLAALSGYNLEGDEALHATRCLRSALHGFVALETGGGFGLALNLDETFDRLLDMLDSGFRSAPQPHADETKALSQ